MLAFLKANIATIIVVLLVAAAVGFAIYIMIKNKKAGKSSCGCNCAGCPNAGSCNLSQERK